MRFLSLIISIYMAFLISVPCADSAEYHGAEGVQKITEAQNHQDHTHESASCSPLCVCMCCTSYAYFQDFQQEKTPLAETVVVEHPYRQSFHSYDYHTIWQPPKIG